jgi:hypothetical protein
LLADAVEFALAHALSLHSRHPGKLDEAIIWAGIRADEFLMAGDSRNRVGPLLRAIRTARREANRLSRTTDFSKTSSTTYGRVPMRLLGTLARFLPPDERPGFVGEAMGNLGDCERWWQRVDHLVGLMLGTPRLAWMMWRENRQGRA